MAKRAIIFMLLFREAVLYHQTDYIVTLERSVVVSYDQNHVPLVKISNFKLNRTQVANNMTVKFATDFGNDLLVHLQAYKFASNEYRQFPISFSANVCGAIATNEFGIQNFYECGNLTRCPLVKGSYSICNWTPDYAKFPPYIPAGSYMLEFRFFYQSAEIMHTQGYAKVTRVSELARY